MSLEEALKANTAAITAHTAALEKMIAVAGKGATAPAAATTAAGKGATAAAGKGTTAAAGKGAAKGPTEADLRKAAGAYLTGSDDADIREARKANVGVINEHYGVGKLTEIGADKYAEVIGYLERLTKGEAVEELGIDAEGGDGDGDALV